MCVRHRVDVTYHGLYVDEGGKEMIETRNDKHIVASGIIWLIATRR